MEQRLSMVTLGVQDMDRAREFYEDGLGWKKANPDEETICFYQLNGFVLSLYDREALREEAGVPNLQEGGIAISYNVHTNEEVDALLAAAEKAGATISAPAKKQFWGGYSGYFVDPEGHVWEIAMNPYTFPDKDGNFIM